MIWLTWRQNRLEGLITALVVVVVAGLVGSLVVSAQPLLEQIRHLCPVVVDDSGGRSLPSTPDTGCFGNLSIWLLSCCLCCRACSSVRPCWLVSLSRAPTRWSGPKGSPVANGSSSSWPFSARQRL